jgi:hypothetical protein
MPLFFRVLFLDLQVKSIVHSVGKRERVVRKVLQFQPLETLPSRIVLTTQQQRGTRICPATLPVLFKLAQQPTTL